MRAAQIRTWRRPRQTRAVLVGLARRPRSALLLGTALQACAMLVVGLPAEAQPAPNTQPQGGRVVAGSAAISQSAGQTTINQSSQRAAVDWTSFDVGRNQTVRFQQPSSSAVTLNRVTGPDPSQIAGKVQANGQIVLTNQSGVIFTQGAQVDAAGLIVSAAGISNRNFMAGRMVFDQPARPDAKIVNEGTITVRQAGLAALVAPQVANSGTINARLGHVVLAGARAATLDLYGDGLISIDVTRQVTEAPPGPDGKRATALITNTGVIQAQGGTVQLSAVAVDGLVTTLVTAGGQITANSRGSRAGTIVVNTAGGGAAVIGTLAAEGRGAGTVGGQVQVNATGPVTVAAGARISVSGRAGGGTVALGTTLARAKGGSSVSAPAASALILQQGATIAADAAGTGKGGKVTLLSAGATRMDGALSARGGPEGGDGGFVEVSGKTLGMSGRADVSAPPGLAGSILLDPDYLTIVTGPGGAGSEDPAFVTGGTIAASGPSAAADTISNGIINGFRGNVLLQAAKTLTVAGNISLADAAHQSLTLEAGGTLTINRGVAVVASGDVILASGGAGPNQPPAGQPSPLISIQGGVESTTGSISLLSGAGGTVAVGTAGLLAAGPGQRLTLQSDALSVASGPGSLATPGGVVEIAPATPQDMAVQGAGGMAVPEAAIRAVDAPTLRLGLATINGTQVTTAREISIHGTLGFPGTIDFQSKGAVAAAGPFDGLDVATVIGASASFDGRGTIRSVGSYAATGGFSIRDVPGLSLTGPITARTASIATTGTGALVVTGSVQAANSLSLSSGHIDLRPGALVQAGTAALTGGFLSLADGSTLGRAGSVLDLNALSGSVTEAATASITGDTLRSTSGISGDLSLLGRNTLAALGTLPIGGRFWLADTAPLAVTGSVLASDVYLRAPAVSVATGGGLLTRSGTVSLETDQLAITQGGAITARNLELAPLSPGSDAVLGSADGGLLSSLDGLSASSIRIGALTRPTGALATTAGTITLAGDFGASPISLTLHSLGGIAQTAGVLMAGVLSVAAREAVSLQNANSVTTLGKVTVGSLLLNDAGQAGTLVIAGPVTGTQVAVGGAGAILLSGSITSVGVLALAAHGGGTSLAAGASVNAGTVDLSGVGGVTQDPAASINTDHLLSSEGIIGNVRLTSTLNAIGTLDALRVSDGVLRLSDRAPLSVQGPVQARSIDFQTGTQPLSILGPIAAAGSIGLSGNGLSIGSGGGVSAPTIAIHAGQGGIALVSGATLGTTGTMLDVSGAGMVEDGGAVIRADTLTSSDGLAGAIGMAGTANAIATLGDMIVSGGLTLADSRDLNVAGTLRAAALRIVDAGIITVSGRVLPAAGSMTATLAGLALDLPGTVSVGSGGTLALQATAGGITSKGQVVAGDLRGSALGDVSLLGTDNEIARVSSFSAGSFALGSGTGLEVAGSLLSDGLVRLESAGTLSISGTIAPLGVEPIAIHLTAAALSLPGLVAGGSGTVRLDATAGNVGQSGTLIAGTLSATATGGITLAGSTPAANGIVSVDTIQAGADVTLNTGGTLRAQGSIAAGPGHSLTLRADGLAIAGSLSAPGGQIFIAPATDGRTVSLDGIRRSSTLSLVQGDLDAIHSGSLTLGAIPGGEVPAEAIEVNGTATLSRSSGPVLALFAKDEIGGAGVLGAAKLTGAAATVALSGANAIGELGNFTASASFSLTNATPLTVSGLVQSPLVAIQNTQPLTLNGIVQSNSANLIASSIALPGTLVGDGQVSLAATEGAITGNGQIVTGLLTGAAATSVLLTGPNQASALGRFSAPAGFTYNNTGPLSVTGTVSSGAGLQLAADGAVIVQGGLTGTRVSVWSSGITLNGGIAGNQAVMLDAGKGAITGSGSIRTNLLTGRAGSLELTGDANSIAALGDVTTSTGLTLSNASNLVISGTATDGAEVNISQAYDLNIAGSVHAPSVSLTASKISIAGGLSAPTSLDLVAQTGGIAETGTIVTGLLTGNAATTASLTGTNTITRIGNFNAVRGFSLSDNSDLVILGGVSGGSFLNLAAQGSILLAGTMAGSSGTLTAGALSIAGALTADNELMLAATRGSISGTGTVATMRLSGNASGDLDLSGPNRILRLDGFTADRIMLANQSDLVLTGEVGNGRSVRIGNAGTITGSAMITGSESVTLDSQTTINLADATIRAGGQDNGAVRLTAARSIGLQNARLDGHVITMDAGEAISIQGGTVSAGDTGSITLGQAASDRIELRQATLEGSAITIHAQDLVNLASGTIRTTGTTIPGRVAPMESSVLPGDGRTGLLISAPRIVQTGTLSIDGSITPAAEFSVTGSLDLATLSASNVWLILDLAQAHATGTDINVHRLDLFYTGTNGGAVLAGTVAGLSGVEAAQSMLIWPYPNTNYTLNGCPIGVPNCILLVRDPVPGQKALQTLDVAAPRPSADDPELLGVLPNVARQDY